MIFKSGETEESEVVWLFGCLPSYLTIRQSEVLLDQQQKEMLEVEKSRCNSRRSWSRGSVGGVGVV